MYVIDQSRMPAQQLGELDGWWTSFRDKIIRPVGGAALAVFQPQIGIPLLLAEQQKKAQQKAMEEAQRQADAAAAAYGGSVPSGDVALQRALALQAAGLPVGSVPSGDVALRRAMGGEDPDERNRRWLMYGAIGAGVLATGALVLILTRNRRN